MKLNRLLGAANRARLAVYLLAPWKLFKHADTPRAPKWLALAVLAYAVIPIDLIPHFIPVLGPLDDLMRLPLGIALAVKLAPDALWQARLCEALRTTPLWMKSTPSTMPTGRAVRKLLDTTRTIALAIGVFGRPCENAASISKRNWPAASCAESRATTSVMRRPWL